MSPASQGALEVERYIGSCLISSTNGGRGGLQKPPLGACHKQEQQQQPGIRSGGKQQQPQCSSFGPVGNWAGGAPLISMASNSRRNNPRSPPGQQQSNQQEQHLHGRTPLSRLAVHTHGAPLILSGRFPNSRAKIHNGQPANVIANCVAGMLNGCNNNSNPSANSMRCHPLPRLNKPMANDQKKPSQQQSMTAKSIETTSKDGTAMATTNANVANIDSLSIASDESSGSNNSENSLPRIIKPRKRRKKDRKPPVLNPSVGPATTSDVKASTIDELQQSTSSEQQQQLTNQQSQQLKSYVTSSYDSPRYATDNYYKGHRRLLNGNVREANMYGRPHPGNNCSSSSNVSTNMSIVSNPQQEVIDTRQSQTQLQQQQQQQHPTQQQSQQQHQRVNGVYTMQHRHMPMKVVDDNRNVILPVCQAKAAANYLSRNGHNNARFIHDYNEPVALTCRQDVSGSIDDCLQGSMCQCRYCDPATLVWDISDQNSFPGPQFIAQPDFHHHHHHHHRYSQLPATVFVARPLICQEHANAIEFFDVADSSCLRLRSDRPDGGATILRRSWSDPTSYFSDEIVTTPNRDIGVIGDRGQSGGDSSKGSRSSWRGDASTAAPSTLENQSSSSTNGSLNAGNLGLQSPLEVSTEIVTSPNGHRDLEIKFYSSSPTSSISFGLPSSEDEIQSSAFGFSLEDDSATNDSEEYSDIWSYHESKLQQDFRTLLQAEE